MQSTDQAIRTQQFGNATTQVLAVRVSCLVLLSLRTGVSLLGRAIAMVDDTYVHKGNKRPGGRYDVPRVKTRPGAFATCAPCVFGKKTFQEFSPPGAIQKNKKTHTPIIRTSLTRTTAQQQQQQGVLVMSQTSSTNKAPPSTDKSTAVDHSNSCGRLRRPGEEVVPPTNARTPAPAPTPAAQVVKRRPIPRTYPPSFELEGSVGPKGRHSYSTATKLRVVDYTRLPCPDGGVVGIRGAATGLGQGLCPKRIRDWVQNEEKIRKENEVGGGKGKKMHAGPLSATQDVEAELVEYINDCRKQRLAVTRIVVLRKLIALKPDALGGIPSSDPRAMKKFHQKFGHWYQRFRRRNKLSIRRKASVGRQKKPSGWEGMAWETIQKIRGVLTGIAKKLIIAKRGEKGGRASAAAGPMDEGDGASATFEATAAELLAVQPEVFRCLYSADQTHIQAEMAVDNTLEKRNAKKEDSIATGAPAGKEKLRYTVMLCARGDGGSVRSRITYKGSRFEGGETPTGRQKKPGKDTIAHEQLPANRVANGYPADGISLSIQPSSRFDTQEGELWTREDFGRRPDSSPSSQPESVLVLDDLRVHKNGGFQKRLKDSHNTATIVIPGGLTPVVQPCDRTINREFKRRLKALHRAWALDQTRNEASGKMPSPSRGQVATWVKEAWGGMSPEVIRQCFKVCGLTLNLDGSEDHAWCLHKLGGNYRELVAEQRKAWQDAHGVELPPLQLPDLIAASDASDFIAAAGAILEVNLTAAPADVPGVPEFTVVDSDENAGDECSDDEDSDDEGLIEEKEGGGAGADDETSQAVAMCVYGASA